MDKRLYQKLIGKFLIVVFFSFTAISCNRCPGLIFDDMYKNINEDPLAYMNNVEFDFKEISYDDSGFPSYAKKYDCKKIYSVKNDSMAITYWDVSGVVQIQYVMIMNKNANHPFSNFIGKNADDVLRKYSKNIEYEKSNSELRYDSEDWTSFIQFNIKDEKISRIVIGKNL